MTVIFFTTFVIPVLIALLLWHLGKKQREAQQRMIEAQGRLDELHRQSQELEQMARLRAFEQGITRPDTPPPPTPPEMGLRGGPVRPTPRPPITDEQRARLQAFARQAGIVIQEEPKKKSNKVKPKDLYGGLLEDERN